MRQFFLQKKTAFETRVTGAAKEAGGVLESRYGIWLLSMISFVEAALIVPIITDPFLIGYVLSNKGQAVRAFLYTTISSVIGGIVAYAIAALLFDYFAPFFLSASSPDEIYSLAEQFEGGTFLITIIGAFTPIPYTVVAMAAGSVKANLLIFVIASVVGRGARYALVAYLTVRFGERALEEAKKRVLATTVVIFILFALYILYKL